MSSPPVADSLSFPFFAYYVNAACVQPHLILILARAWLRMLGGLQSVKLDLGMVGTPWNGVVLVSFGISAMHPEGVFGFRRPRIAPLMQLVTEVRLGRQWLPLTPPGVSTCVSSGDAGSGRPLVCTGPMTSRYIFSW